MNNLAFGKIIGIIILAILALVVIVKMLSFALKLAIPIVVIGFAAYGVYWFLKKKGVLR